MNAYLSLSLIILVSLSACNNEMKYVSIIDPSTFDDTSFQTHKVLVHEEINSEIIGSLARMSLIGDHLFIVDSKLDSIIHVVNVKNNTYTRKIIPRGNGPGEMLSAENVVSSIDQKAIWLYDLTQRQWNRFCIADIHMNKWNREADKIQFSKIDKHRTYIESPIWISDSLFVCLDLYSYENRFLIFDRQINLIDSIKNPKLRFNCEIQSEILSDIFSSHMDVSPDCNHIVLAGRYLDIIEIYSRDGKLKELMKGPTKDFDFKYDESKSIQNGSLIKSPDTKRAFVRIKTTHQKIYLLYSGRTKSDPDHYSYGRIVYVFDYNGTPLAKYELDTLIADFAIDKSDSTWYAIAYPELSIVKFKLE